MNAEVIAILRRISADLNLLADIAQKELGNGVEPSISSSGPKTRIRIEVPIIQEKYIKEEAEAEKKRIDRAYMLKEINYDKKRGMKMLVTKRTEGWSPEKNL